jgi:leucyl/phenylalanyl-tRNA--protein transferase
VTEHLASLGAAEIGRRNYHAMLNDALAGRGDFLVWPKDRVVTGGEALAALE